MPINPGGYDWIEEGENPPERLPVVVNVPSGSESVHVQAEMADGIPRDGNGEIIPQAMDDEQVAELEALDAHEDEPVVDEPAEGDFEAPVEPQEPEDDVPGTDYPDEGSHVVDEPVEPLADGPVDEGHVESHE